MPNLLLLVLLCFASLIGTAVADDWRTVDSSRIAIAVDHPDFQGRKAISTVRVHKDAVRTAEGHWVRIGSLNADAPTITAVIHTETAHYGYWTLKDSLYRKSAFAATSIDILSEPAEAASAFGTLKYIRILVRANGAERECGYWHGRFDGSTLLFDGWYCPLRGQPATDEAIKAAIGSVRPIARSAGLW